MLYDCLNTLSRYDKYLGNFNHVARAISQKWPEICHSYTRMHRRVVKHIGIQTGKQRIGWWHVMQIVNLTAFYMKDLSTTSACYKMSDLENFVAASGAASRHTAMMWWDVVTEANKMLCNISRRILSYQKKLSKMSIFEEIQVLERQKYRPRSLSIGIMQLHRSNQVNLCMCQNLHNSLYIFVLFVIFAQIQGS